MLKQVVQLEEKVEDRVYTLTMLPNAPAGEVIDVLFKMRATVLEIVNNVHKVDAKKEEPVAEEQPKE